MNWSGGSKNRFKNSLSTQKASSQNNSRIPFMDKLESNTAIPSKTPSHNGSSASQGSDSPSCFTTLARNGSSISQGSTDSNNGLITPSLSKPTVRVTFSSCYYAESGKVKYLKVLILKIYFLFSLRKIN